MTIFIDLADCAYQIQAVAMLFLEGEAIRVVEGAPPPGETRYLYAAAREDGGAGGPLLTARVLMDGRLLEETRRLPPGDPRSLEWAFGRMLYRLLHTLTGVTPPWGILTGVRPIRLVLDKLGRGWTEDGVRRHFSRELLVSPEKTRLALETARVQRPILGRGRPGRVMLYVSIPFCPTRCRYCSFVSHSIAQAGRLIPAYVEMLCAEIAALGALAARRGLRADAVYFGGGTPVSLEADALRRVMEAVRSHFDLDGDAEYTVEAGRPDAFTDEKLAALASGGARRISINPQTMQDPVLALAGRPHTAADVRSALRMARRHGFQSVNMDLIAGLEGDSREGFLDSLNQTLALGPENVTVHALSVKRAAGLAPAREEVLRQNPRGGVAHILEEAGRVFRSAGYRPYYLYRQKNTVDNLENTGYSLPGHENVYNIRIMDESSTILAAGAGGVTKLVRPAGAGADLNGRAYEIKRIFGFKYPYEYIRRFDELSRRRALMDRFLAT